MSNVTDGVKETEADLSVEDLDNVAGGAFSTGLQQGVTLSTVDGSSKLTQVGLSPNEHLSLQ